MMTLDMIVGRLLELETKYMELQELYSHLINEYEKLKDQHIPSGNWQTLTEEELANLVEYEDWYNFPADFAKTVENKLKEKNAYCIGHRNQLGTRYNSPSGDQ